MSTRNLILALSWALLAFMPQEQRVRIFVGTFEPPGQFLEPGYQDRVDSAEDLEKCLKQIWESKKLLDFVKDRATADVVVEVAGRTVIATGGQVTTVVPNGFGGFVANSYPRKAAYVFVWLRASGFDRQLAGTGGRWMRAGQDLAHQVLDWIKANQQSVLARRK